MFDYFLLKKALGTLQSVIDRECPYTGLSWSSIRNNECQMKQKKKKKKDEHV